MAQSTPFFSVARVRDRLIDRSGWFGLLFLGVPAARNLLFSARVTEIHREGSDWLAPLELSKSNIALSPTKPQTVVDPHLPESFFLKREIEAPRKARRDLYKLAELDLVRRTPFKATEVSFVLSPPEADGDQLHATQWIAKKTDLGALRSRLTQLGLPPRRFFIKGHEAIGPIADFSSTLAPAARLWRRINGALAVITLAAFGAVWLAPAFQASRQLSALQSQLEAERGTVLALRQQYDALREAETERANFVDSVVSHPKLSTALRELTIALPDDTWIGALALAKGRMVISGETGSSAAGLVLQITERRDFSNPRLTGAVSRLPGGGERFELSIDLAGAS